MKIILISFLLVLFTWATIPFFWKITGGSFIHRNTVIYKGKELFEATENCSVAVVGKDFNKVKQVCLSNKLTVVRTWVNGVETTNDVTK